MLSASILHLLFFLHLTKQQLYFDCADGGNGPCINFICQSPTELCIVSPVTPGGPLDTMCCEQNQIVFPGATSSSSPGTASSSSPITVSSAATTTPPCVDLTNPSTGVSDCPRLAYLCTNALYWTLMTQQCPKTCNRCDGAGTPPPSTCQDLVDYRTGVSNCAQVASYCRNTLYLELMRIQCPKTCGYCV